MYNIDRKTFPVRLGRLLVSSRCRDDYVEEGIIRPDSREDEVEIADPVGGDRRARWATVVVRASASVPCWIHRGAVDVYRKYSDLFLTPVAYRNRNVPIEWVEVYVLDREAFLRSCSLLLEVRPLAGAVGSIAIVSPSY